MLFLLITCSGSFSLIFLLWLRLSPNPMRFFPPCFWNLLSLFPKPTLGMLLKKKNSSSSSSLMEAQASREASVSGMSFLDLPDLVLECILQKLPPEGLSRMASVCASLRDMCARDHLWEDHMRHKWGKIMSPNFCSEWAAASAANSFFNHGKDKGLLEYLEHLWPPIGLIRSRFRTDSVKKTSPPPDSVMAWYLALEFGTFWFPAQVYNRENGHVGFMLSCYDAELSYDRRTDTFQARYPPHGRRISSIESGVTWDRLRASPVHTSPLDLHVSDCLHELQPGDQIEIQWRRNKEFPYGWWYGIVGHLETCDGNPNYCRCHDSDTLVLEFNQYTRGSRWRTTSVNRKDHREEGNEADGFYGGIRKLCGNEEISKWEKLWPVHVLE